jgi:hypothetical protein
MEVVMADVKTFQRYSDRMSEGARFTVYLSPANETSQSVTRWSATIVQQGGGWSGRITSDDAPPVLETPAAGTFDVSVWASGPQIEWQEIATDSGDAAVTCVDGSEVMIGIVAVPGGYGATFWMNMIAPLPIHP